MKKDLFQRCCRVILGVSFVWTVLLAACNAPRPMAVPTTTEEPALLESLAPTAINTPFPTVTPIPPAATLSPTATFTPTLTPTLAASAYRLRPSMESNGAEMAGKAFAYDDSSEWVSYENWQDYSRLFGAEYLLRFPQSQNWVDKAWLAARSDPHGIPLPGMRPGQDLFSFLLEMRLNLENATLADLETALQERPFYLENTLEVDNLFGDGQVAIVFQVRAAWPTYCAVYAVRTVGGKHRLESLLAWEECQWAGKGRTYSLEQHKNYADGMPEVLIKIRDGYSGLPNRQSQVLWLYKWSDDHFLSQSFVLFGEPYEQTCGREGRGQSPCLSEWRFEGPKLITTEYWYTQGDCPDLALEHTYRLDGGQYIPAGDVFLPPTAADPVCRAAWAEAVILFGKARWKDDRAIGTLAAALEQWPSGDTPWGPAGGDYLRLRLGIWQDLRGESQPALASLQALADHPTDPQYDLPSRMAGDYLRGRAGQGALGACTQVEVSWQDALREVFSDGPYSLREISSRWGLSNGHWDMFDVGYICYPMSVMPLAASTQPITNQAELQSWLAEVGLPVYSIQPGDLNGDGLEDWVVLFTLRSLGFPSQIWAFTQIEAGLHASFVSTFWILEENTPIALQFYRPLPDVVPVHVLQFGADFVVFRITVGGELEWVDEYLYNGNFQIDEQPAGTVLTVYQEEYYQPTTLITYTWDAATQTIFKQDIGYDFIAVEGEAERLLFQERDFPAAIALIESVLTKAPPEPRVRLDDSQYAPAWYYPYLRYLLGLAYEMNNQPDQAVVVYYSLMKDYPDHPFGRAAADKLVLIP